MLDEYHRIIEDGTDVTETFDISKVSVTSVVYKNRIVKDNIKLMPYYQRTSDIFNTYSVLQDGSYHIILISNMIHKNISDWYEGHPLLIEDYDIDYIKKATEYKVYKFKNSWFNLELNSDEMCGYEMEKIIPYIRKYKINKLLNV